jgi:hypothetical protein
MTETETPKLSYNAKYYNAKIKTNPEFYEKELRRVCKYIHNRYNTDEEYKQRFYSRKRSIINEKNRRDLKKKHKMFK